MNQEAHIHSALPRYDLIKRLAFALALSGVMALFLSLTGLNMGNGFVMVYTLLSVMIGTSVYAWRKYHSEPAGIKNNYVTFTGLTGRGLLGWVIGFILTGFYVVLYWYPEILGLGINGVSNSGIIKFFDPLSFWIKNTAATQWFVYGTLYTLAILALGVKVLFKYRTNNYQKYRTLSIMVVQLFLAYLIPEILEAMRTGQPYFDADIKNIWPLNYDFFHAWHLDNMKAGGSLGMFYLVLGIAMFLVVTPVVTYFFGKRWYCSWVCGCGGLAETAGDSFRQNSSKTLASWKAERWIIHSVMVLVFLMTVATLYGYFAGKNSFFGLDIYTYFQRPYGFVIGAMFSGVVGVGFYPILGTRVWCRFGCPLAGYLGILQKYFSKFRITVNGGQCISCGNCSKYCEMGIDVRSYAQKGQNIVRSSCVGCGICSSVCPRGVLKLENGSMTNKVDDNPILIGRDGAKINL
ncbi:MAG: 4Fe-4S binding protein [Flavobacteriales bacterium]|nr:4Fe-4S binding protein [Flavobacteriales bacterium]